MNNLFLTGPIQVGKSTILREALTPWLELDPTPVAGFSCQRFIVKTPSSRTSDNENADHKKTIAFRLGRAQDPIEVHIPDGFQESDLQMAEIIHSGNVFKYFDSCGAHVNMDVFNTAGVQYIQEAADDSNKLALLDEIGGHELVCEEFFNELVQLLQSDIPCVGVLKSQESAARMTEHMAQKSRAKALQAEQIQQRNRLLHEKIAGESGDLLIWVEGNDESRGQALQQVRAFVRRFL